MLYYHTLRAITDELAAIRAAQETTMATLADIVAADAAVKAELDEMGLSVDKLVKSNQDLADKLTAAQSTGDPAALQAALDQAKANVVEGQAIVDKLAGTPPAPTPEPTPAPPPPTPAARSSSKE